MTQNMSSLKLFCDSSECQDSNFDGFVLCWYYCNSVFDLN